MSRVTYNEDDQWGWIRWAGAAKKAINGKQGQALLKELEAALLALPEPKLIAGEFAMSDGEVCALGALALARGVPAEEMAKWEEDPETAETKLGMSYTLAWEIIAANDDGAYPGHSYYAKWTDEKRYEYVLNWIRQHLAPQQPAAGGQGE
jgi:hypothetical protein